MKTELFEQDVEQALTVLRGGGVILYPTDTIWGLGCDATNEDAVRRIYAIKQREDSKSLIILLSEEREILQYVAAPDLAAFEFMQQQARPTTVIFDGAIGLPPNLVAADGSIAIRLARDPFCRHLVKRLRKPVVSTSANTSGQPSPPHFAGIDPVICSAVDYVVRWRQDDQIPAQPSQIIRWNSEGNYTVIRS